MEQKHIHAVKTVFATLRDAVDTAVQSLYWHTNRSVCVLKRGAKSIVKDRGVDAQTFVFNGINTACWLPWATCEGMACDRQTDTRGFAARQNNAPVRRITLDRPIARINKTRAKVNKTREKINRTI